ncbi:hypothetical protein BRADI_1g56190v3 [Brachypodium distachyon]|uniref:Late embryogenesis abundant protein LEA-2 subgroup domain-containing protein n=1 Tax=Brachypodium distachyon TaxID=15368 RepID=A0A0Q3HDW5_BRADI|nr:hypothetical protein BRADI_1g56190v3 [Brachypodium distachyon]
MAASQPPKEAPCSGLCCLAILIIIVGFTLAMVYGIPSRNLYVSIDSVSGLDSLPSPSPATDDLDLGLNPAFNLMLRVNSDSPGRHACLDAGTYMEVSYRCFLLAASAALPADLCVAPKRSADWHVVARGVGVRLPGFLVDALVADARSGAEAFDVTIRRAAGDYYYYGGTVASCGARRPGDAPGMCHDGI